MITGMGAVCAVAHDCASLLDAINSGRTGIERIRRFDTCGFGVHTGAEVKGWCEPPDGAWGLREARLCSEFAHRAASEAVVQAGLDAAYRPERVGLVIGTLHGNLEHSAHELTTELAEELGIEGPRLTVCTACSSSTGAIGLARDLVAMGSVDVVLAGGADVLTPRVFAGFHALGVLNPERCAPFSMPFGTTLGEGAGFLVVERGDSARARKAEVLVALSGYGLSGDGYHETSPDPGGAGVERALRAALADAALCSEDVGYVNAHGSGTEANDSAEWSGIQRGLGLADTVPVSSSKGALGHAQGAAGALETIVTILMMRRGQLAPTLNFVGSRRFAPPDPVVGPLPRKGSYRHAVCLNSAFGGSNAAIVISEPSAVRVDSRERAPVEVLGIGLVGRHGLGVEAFETSLDSGSHGRVPPFSFNQVAPRVDPHGLDPTSRFLTAAAALALRDGGVPLTRAARAQVGLVSGSIRPSPESLSTFGRSVEELGLPQASAPAFARIVLNAPAGFCSKLLSLKGPLAALSVGAGSGLAAILLGAELLSTRDDVQFMLGAGVDELAETEDGEGGSIPAGEGAACVLLGVAAAGSACVGRASVTSWGVAGPGQVKYAIEQACGGIDQVERPVDHVFDERDFGETTSGEWAMPSALAFAAATLAIRRGQVRRALVTSNVGRSMSMALLVDA